MRVSLIIVGIAVPTVALAQPAAPDPARSPGFVFIDHFDGTSVVGGDFTYISPDGLLDDVTLVRFQLEGRFVDPASRFGGYARLPISYASGEGEDLTGIGNLELGALMLPKIGDGSTSLVLHGGITLPTGSDDDEAFANLFSALARPQDIFLAIPKGTSLRFGASPLIRSGNVFARFDLGIDINLDVGDSSDEIDPSFHINAGVGVDLGKVAVMGELSNVYFSDDGDDDDLADNLIHLIALSVRGHTTSVMPYGALIIPIDDQATSAVDLAFTLGVEGRL